MKITNKNDIRVSNNSKNIAADSPHENRSRVRPIESAVAINQPRPHNKAAVQSNSKENYSNQDSPKKLKSLMNSPPRQSSNQNPQLNQRVRESMSNTRASEEQEMKLLAEIEELNRKQAHIKHDAGNENASLFKKDDVVDQQKGKPVRGVHPSDEARPRAISRGKVSIANGSVDKVGEERSISSMRSKQKPAVERPKMLKVKDEVKEREKLAFKAGAKDMKPQKESRHATPNPQRLVKEWSSALERDKPTNGENNSVISNEPSVDSGKSPVEQLAYQLMAADGGGYLNMFKKKVDVKARSNSRRQQRKYQSDEQSVDSHARSEGNHTNRSGKEDYQETSSLPVLVSPRHLEKARAIQQGENSHPMQSRRVNNRSNKTLSAPSGQQKEMVPNAAQREAANGFPPPVRRSHDYGDQESVPSLIPQRKGKSSIPVRK